MSRVVGKVYVLVKTWDHGKHVEVGVVYTSLEGAQRYVDETPVGGYIMGKRGFNQWVWSKVEDEFGEYDAEWQTNEVHGYQYRVTERDLYE